MRSAPGITGVQSRQLRPGLVTVSILAPPMKVTIWRHRRSFAAAAAGRSYDAPEITCGGVAAGGRGNDAV
jgi:hypothetical protein